MLKTWDGDRSGWRVKLSKSTTVCIADTDVGVHHKPWWIYLAQTIDPPPIRSGLPGKHFLLLSWREARALVQYLLDAGCSDWIAKAKR